MEPEIWTCLKLSVPKRIEESEDPLKGIGDLGKDLVLVYLYFILIYWLHNVVHHFLSCKLHTPSCDTEKLAVADNKNQVITKWCGVIVTLLSK